METSTPAKPELSRELAYQHASLQGVSRTFALTIPQLPESLRDIVGNAYLLCRIADTIEDSDSLTTEQKRRFGDMFVRVVAGEEDPAAFGGTLAPLLQGSTLDAERELVAHTPAVIRITHSLGGAEQAALLRCVRIMSGGMEEFQEGNFRGGLRDLAHLDAYCYHVAGVVGEMLTELFCLHTSASRRREKLEARAVSFGQALQMTNILKDIWDDKARGVCWLPQDHFPGLDLEHLQPGHDSEIFRRGLIDLVAVAHGHLQNALDYTLLIPRREGGLRRFCLWAAGMAVLTLRNIHANPDFTSGDEVKITRRTVKGVIIVTRLFGWSNGMMRLFFRLAAGKVPRKRV